MAKNLLKPTHAYFLIISPFKGVATALVIMISAALSLGATIAIASPQDRELFQEPMPAGETTHSLACVKALVDSDPRQEFMAEFRETIRENAKSMGLTTEALSQATVDLVFGIKQFSHNSAYILKSGTQAWWFATEEKGKTKIRRCGRLNFTDITHNDKSSELAKIIGPVFGSRDLNFHYSFVEAHHKYQMVLKPLPPKTLAETVATSPGPLARKFVEMFGATLDIEAPRLGLTFDDVKDLRFYEITGDGGPNSKATGFIVKNLKNTWWFAESRVKSKTQKLAGRLNEGQTGDQLLHDIFGDHIRFLENSRRLEFSAKTKTYIKVRSNLEASLRQIKEKLAEAHPDKVEAFMKVYGETLLSEARKGNLDLRNLQSGDFQFSRSDYADKKEFWLFVPDSPSAKAYFFVQEKGIAYVLNLNRDDMADDVKNSPTPSKNPIKRSYTLSERAVAWQPDTFPAETFRPWRYRRVFRLENHELLLFAISGGNLFFKIVDPKFIAEIKRALIEKDRIEDQFEDGAYTEFAQKYLEAFIILNYFTADELTSYESFKIIGQGHSFDDPSRKFTVIEFRGLPYYYGEVDGLIYSDRIPFSDNLIYAGPYKFEDRPSSYVWKRHINNDFLKVYGYKVILPGGKLLTVNRMKSLLRQKYFYSVTDSASSFDAALDAFTKGPVAGHDERANGSSGEIGSDD